MPVVFSACAHQPGDPEFATFGACVVGTSGQQKVPETLLPKQHVVPDRSVRLPDLRLFQQVVIEKRFSMCSAIAKPILRQLGESLRVVMYGVATDICVASAAQAFVDRGYHVELVHDAIAALDEQKTARYLDALSKRGGRLVETDDLLRETKLPNSTLALP